MGYEIPSRLTPLAHRRLSRRRIHSSLLAEHHHHHRDHHPLRWCCAQQWHALPHGNNITFTTHGGGLNLAGRAFCQTVTSGALAGSLTVPNPALTLPANICYHAKVSDAGNNQTIDLGITCTIAGSSFSFDTALLGGAPSTFPSTALQVAPSTPANSSAACTAGQIWVDATYVYVCTATNTIKRAALSSI